MFSIKRPNLPFAVGKRNRLGLSLQDYRGAESTLCGGCGHDSVTAAIIQACFELALDPAKVVKLSGIGCSSKTPAYFLQAAHGFNAVHGRMPSVATGANAAQRSLTYLAVSGDGDTGSIGLGQFMHCLRRGVKMLYIIENNGVYGLTKGQFSALADKQSTSKRGELNPWEPIDPVLLAIQLGAAFVGRGFSGDKEQLVPLIKAGLQSQGFALLDVLSPCVSFNNHEGSTKSYAHIRAHEKPVQRTAQELAWEADEATHLADYTPERASIELQYPQGQAVTVRLHDGSELVLSKGRNRYELGDKSQALAYVEACKNRGEIATGLLFCDPEAEDYHARNATDARALRDLAWEELRLTEQDFAALNAELQ